MSICRHRSQEIALLVAITPLEQFVQGFLDCLFGGHGFMCMSPLRNKNIHIKPLVDDFIIVDSAISIVPILVISPNFFCLSTGFDTTDNSSKLLKSSADGIVLCIMYCDVSGLLMDQFRNDVALWVNKLRGRYEAIFIEPENVNKIS